jgi:hypothetical protein
LGRLEVCRINWLQGQQGYTNDPTRFNGIVHRTTAVMSVTEDLVTVRRRLKMRQMLPFYAAR